MNTLQYLRDMGNKRTTEQDILLEQLEHREVTMTKRMSADEQMEAMDAAAFLAHQELETAMQSPEAQQAILAVAKWWKKWYLKAGHKRLGRLLAKLG